MTGVSVNGDKVTINRWYYRQRMEAALQRQQRPWFILIDPGNRTACECGVGTATVENAAVALPDSAMRTTVTGFHAPAADEADHPARRTIIVRHRRGLDEETSRRPDTRAGGGKIDSRFSATGARVAGQQQSLVVAVGPGAWVRHDVASGGGPDRAAIAAGVANADGPRCGGGLVVYEAIMVGLLVRWKSRPAGSYARTAGRPPGSR